MINAYGCCLAILCAKPEKQKSHVWKKKSDPVFHHQSLSYPNIYLHKYMFVDGYAQKCIYVCIHSSTVLFVYAHIYMYSIYTHKYVLYYPETPM